MWLAEKLDWKGLILSPMDDVSNFLCTNENFYTSPTEKSSNNKRSQLGGNTAIVHLFQTTNQEILLQGRQLKSSKCTRNEERPLKMVME
jgi:hypothetical protein